jgi:hypothetical protein
MRESVRSRRVAIGRRARTAWASRDVHGAAERFEEVIDAELRRHA